MPSMGSTNTGVSPEVVIQALSELLEQVMASHMSPAAMMPHLNTPAGPMNMNPGIHMSPGFNTNPGIGSFLGTGSGSGSGNSAWNPGGAISNYNSNQASQLSGAANTSQLPMSSSEMGSRLASSIRNRPVPPNCRPGYCYRGVKHHLRQVGVNLTGGSAYMAADQLARSGRFREVRVSRQQLRSLPAGAVVVWDRNPSAGKRHGHISIATGDGREASDRIRRQSVNYPSRHRVFIPR